MITEAAFERRFPGLKKHFLRRIDLNVDEKKYVGENFEEDGFLLFVRGVLKKNNEWILPVKIKPYCPVELRSREELVVQMNVQFDNLIIIGRRENKTKYHDGFLETATFILSKEDNDLSVYLSDDLSVCRIPGERIFSETEKQKILHERKMGKVVKMAGDVNGENDSRLNICHELGKMNSYRSILRDLIELVPVSKIEKKLISEIPNKNN